MDLTLGVTLAVLAAGLLHAGWTLLKRRPEATCCWTPRRWSPVRRCALALLAFVPLPDPAAWPFIAASTAIHFGYTSRSCRLTGSAILVCLSADGAARR
jgi:hypothetical protein